MSKRTNEEVFGKDFNANSEKVVAFIAKWKPILEKSKTIKSRRSMQRYKDNVSNAVGDFVHSDESELEYEARESYGRASDDCYYPDGGGDWIDVDYSTNPSNPNNGIIFRGHAGRVSILKKLGFNLPKIVKSNK